MAKVAKIAHTRARKSLRELPSVKPLPPGAGARVMPRSIKNNVTSPTWLAKGAGKAHAFLFPTDKPRPVTGDVSTVCGRSLGATELTDAKGVGRCKSCVKLLPSEPTRKGKALSEPKTETVATGMVHGSPQQAEAKRVAELKPLFGEGSKLNATLAEQLRAGDKSGARDTAKAVDRAARAVAPLVPKADRTPVGQRDHGALDGVAMVQGPNMNANEGGVTNWSRPEIPRDQLPNCLKGAPIAEANPDAPRRTRVNPSTGEIEPAAARLDGSLRERVDRTVVPDATDRDGFVQSSAKRTKSSKRRHRAKKQAERMIRERIEGRGGKFVPQGRMVPTVKSELRRLAAKGESLPVKGW